LFEYAAFKVYLPYTLNAVELINHKKTGLPLVLIKYIKRLAELPLLQQRKFITFLFFLVLSVTFWFVRSLSEQYETNVTYPVRYTNFPENKVLIGEMPDKLLLKVRAKGFSILRSRLNLNLVPLKFNVNSFSLNSIGADTFYIITGSVKDILSSELDNMSILDIKPDTLFFRFTEIVVKKVAVLPKLAMHDNFFRQQFMLNGKISILPDSIIISGPGLFVRSIHQVMTKPLNYTNLTDTIAVECSLEPIDKITFSQNKVRVSIPVDRFTEVEERLSVVPVNVPESLNMIAIPGQVTVTYRICLSNYSKVVNNPPAPKIDYNAIQEKTLSRLVVFLTDTPHIISNIRFSPKETEFLITRK
jgi:hypothetical protein